MEKLNVDVFGDKNFSAIWRNLVFNGTWTGEWFTKTCLENLAKQRENTSFCENYENRAFRYVYPSLLCLAFFGCFFTLTVYGSKFLSNTSTVLFLSVKALSNFFGVLCLSTEMLRHFYFPSFYKRRLINGTDDNFEMAVWYGRPYSLFLANYFGTLAVWCTLIITLETYICVGHPILFRKFCTKKNGYKILISLIILGVLHHVALPIVLKVEKNVVCFQSFIMYTMSLKNDSIYQLYEKIYFYVNCIIVIIVPNSLMLILSLLIAYHLKFKSLGDHFSQRRRCVLRITITTTVCYLILETPNLLMFLPAAIRGTDHDVVHGDFWCLVNVVTNFLAMLNAVVPFFVYVTFNGTFRKLLLIQLTSCRLIKFGTKNSLHRRREIETSCFISNYTNNNNSQVLASEAVRRSLCHQESLAYL